MLAGKRIILGVSGSIAAYKSAFLVRLLVKSGAEVKVIMTPSAGDFIGALTLSTLSGNPVHSTFTYGSEGQWVNHVDLGLWADAMIVAPASANTLAGFAAGLCNTLLGAVYLSARCPVFLAPAMDLDMWKHPATQSNITLLKQRGCTVIDPGDGELASGLSGVGRMAEPDEICSFLESYFEKQGSLTGKKILLTAGPTREPIDAVRYISNYSSGKMGYAIAEELALRGAGVILVSGPVEIKARNSAIKVVHVESALEMYEACTKVFPEMDAAILSAAVADYRPGNIADGKLKKSDSGLELKLEKTRDILAELGRLKKPGQILAGFALETEREREYAEGKLKNKNLDLIVVNKLSSENMVFNSSENKADIYLHSGEWKSYPKKSKELLAKDIVDELTALLRNE